MILTNKKYKKLLMMSSLLVIILFGAFTEINFWENNIYSTGLKNDESNLNASQGTYTVPYSDELLEDNGFDSGSTFWKTSIDDSNNDINTVYNTGSVSFDVLGNEGSYNYSEIPVYADWGDDIDNPYTNYWCDSAGYVAGEGVSVTHEWHDGSEQDQHAGAYWQYDISTDINISDYKVVQAELDAIVSTQPNTGSSPLEAQDSAKLYVEIRDLAGSLPAVRVASIETIGTTSLTYEHMTVLDQNILISVIESALADNSQQFSIFLGIEAEFVDNVGAIDDDRWNYLRINYFSLNFTYQKIIDYDSKASFYQTVAAIPSAAKNIEANLTLSFWGNTTWPSASPNSALRFVFNNNDPHTETINLLDSLGISPATFDVTNRIVKGSPFNVSIELVIKDFNFYLDHGIKISIDDVYLSIAYDLEYEETLTRLSLFINNENITGKNFADVIRGETFTISAEYTNQSGDVIDNATVYLIGPPSVTNYSMTQSTSGSNYTAEIDSGALDYGVKYFTLYASQDTYESQTIPSIRISVIDRYAYIDKLYMNGTDYTSTQTMEDWPSGDLLNITVEYIDNETEEPIQGANVKIQEGLVEIGGFSEDLTDHYYYFLLDTTGKSKGAYYYTITADKENCTLDSLQITVLIELKATQIRLYINGTEQFEDDVYSVDILDEALNISIEYRSSSGIHLTEPSITNLLVGGVVHWNLEEDLSNEIYYVIVNITDFNETTNSMSVFAEKEGFAPIDIDFIILIEDVQTVLTTNITDLLNVPYLSNFTVQFNYTQDGPGEEGISTTFISHNWNSSFSFLTEFSPGQYRLTCNTSGYPTTVHTLKITINPPNYEPQIAVINIQVVEIATDNLILWINGTQRNDGYVVESDVYDTLNISVEFRSSDKHLESPSSVRLFVGGIPTWNLIEDPAHEIYTKLINIVDLNGTTNTMYIFAEKEGYLPKGFNFFIYVGEVQTSTSIFLNNENMTGDLSMTLAMGRTLNVTVEYSDRFGNYISNAIVTLECSNPTLNLQLQEASGQYYFIIINTTDFIGEDLTPRFHIKATKQNFGRQDEDIYLTIRQRNVEIQLINGQLEYNLTKGANVRIQFRLFDTDYNEYIEGVIVYYRIFSSVSSVTDVDGVYEIYLTNLPSGNFELNMYSGETDYYGQGNLDITFNVKNPSDESFLYTIIWILIIGGIILAVGFSGYIYAYQKVLKYPKPVRKVRKYKNNLKKRTFKGPEVVPREQAFDQLYKNDLGEVGRTVKIKNMDLSSIAKQPLDKALKKTPDEENKQ
ncbi:MAG: hypothetical protein JW891_06545 [Candidatus Lokiarchaeota archaeon]|nr:hypothetical protein [Candidatus Lokiarchaeota archaeon]